MGFVCISVHYEQAILNLTKIQTSHPPVLNCKQAQSQPQWFVQDQKKHDQGLG